MAAAARSRAWSRLAFRNSARVMIVAVGRSEFRWSGACLACRRDLFKASTWSTKWHNCSSPCSEATRLTRSRSRSRRPVSVTEVRHLGAGACGDGTQVEVARNPDSSFIPKPAQCPTSCRRRGLSGARAGPGQLFRSSTTEALFDLLAGKSANVLPECRGSLPSRHRRRDRRTG